jgi:hypothetical protein
MVKRKLLDMARDTLRRKHLSYRTEQTYIYWMRKFILFHGKRHPLDMGETEVSHFRQKTRSRHRALSLTPRKYLREP